MSTTSLTVSNQLLTTTMFARLKELVSQIDREWFFLSDLEKLGKEEESGGERMIIPLNFNRHSQGTQLRTGYEEINLSASPLGTPGHEGWFDYIRPVIISGHENRINRDKHKILSILDTRIRDTYEGAREEFQTQVLKGSVAQMSDCLSLNGVDVAGGILEAADYGSQTHTVHNVSKSTYSGSVHWQNQYGDVQDSASAYLLDTMYDIETRIGVFAKNDKARWYLTIAASNHLKRALQSNERYVDEKSLDGGKRVLTFGGVPVQTMADSDMPIAGASSTATPISGFRIDWNWIKFVAQKGAYFKSGEFKDQSGFEVQASYMNLMGQLRVKRMSSCAVLANAEQW